jgi:hypothetical protein
MDKDFNKWLLGTTNWKEVLYLHNTGNMYQHKQDLTALFWNSYAYVEQKAKAYYNEFGVMPKDALQQLITEFRKCFAASGRIEGINYFDDLITLFLSSYDNQQVETKTDKFKSALSKHGFFELKTIKKLSDEGKQTIVELISSKPMPYGIAMFDYLGFLKYLDEEQKAKYKTDKILSRLYNENAKDGSSAKHYRRSLLKSLDRYKAIEYKETVKNDYQKLK